MKNALLTNWRTSLPALGLLLVAVGHYIVTGHIDQHDVMAVIGALGLGAASDAGGQ